MTKRFVVPALAALILTSAAVAQAQVGGGIKAGVNFATLSGITDVDTEQRVGLVAGGFMTVGIVPSLAFEPEVLFSMQGSKLHVSKSGVSTDAKANIDYVQIPLLLRIGNSGKSTASLYAVVGPSIGFLMGAKIDGEDFSDELKKADVGLVVGAGVTLTRFLIEGRYTVGLTDLNKPGLSTEANKNRVLSLLVGLHF
jgi:hypothetical protein